MFALTTGEKIAIIIIIHIITIGIDENGMDRVFESHSLPFKNSDFSMELYERQGVSEMSARRPIPERCNLVKKLMLF